MIRIPVLDGWRGISIALVLVGHLFPVGPKSWELNAATAGMGMALFFTLSGFLICKLLLSDQRVLKFLLRRIARIIPLAWVVILAIYFWEGHSLSWLTANLTFTANIPPIQLSPMNGPFWSLCVEMQFYLFAALIVAIAGRVSLYLIPVLLLVVTAYKFQFEPGISILTLSRIDEIFAGCALALIHERLISRGKTVAVPISVIFLLGVGLFVSTWSYGGELNYLRPYFASMIIGSTLFLDDKSHVKRLLTNKTLVYIATVSYALYVFHGPLVHTWLGDGDTFEKYLKRPLLLATVFLLAHVSTKYYEAFFMRKARSLFSRD